MLVCMAVAEAAKLLEKSNDDDNMDNDDKDDSIAEAGNKTLKLLDFCCESGSVSSGID
ncbi:hypothetical protein EC991_011122 [Linnemannia zychae]|nr:hypothetical protein EC991_011122 [Linnemannia zychae]